MVDIVDRFVVIEERNDVYREWEGKGVDDGVDDFFKGGGCRCLVGVGVRGHREFNNNMDPFRSVVIIINSAVLETTCLETKVGFIGSALFFEEGSYKSSRRDDVGSGEAGGSELLERWREYV